jgi:putative oligomerization/nucleic acid binding protein
LQDAWADKSLVPASAAMLEERRGWLARIGAAFSAAMGVVAGIAPHVLHHVGPLAGAALLAGAGSSVLFGAIGFALMIPMLLRLRRRFGTWAAPGVALVLFAAAFTVSTLRTGPAIRGDSGGSSGAAGRSLVASPRLRLDSRREGAITMWHTNDGMGWWMVFVAVFWVLFWASLVYVFMIAIVRPAQGRRPSEDDALEIAKRRLARGEISTAEFQDIRRHLEGNASGPQPA